MRKCAFAEQSSSSSQSCGGIPEGRARCLRVSVSSTCIVKGAD